VNAEVGYLALKSYSEITNSEIDDLFNGLAFAGGIGISTIDKRNAICVRCIKDAN